MKKRNLKSLKLNKKSISNFEVNGGALPRTLAYCDVPPYTEGDNCNTLATIAGLDCVYTNVLCGDSRLC